MTKNFHDYLTIGEAAGLVGVSIDTLRNWDRAGKLRAIRHPINGYRLYRREELESLLGAAAVQPGGVAGTASGGPRHA